MLKAMWIRFACRNALVNRRHQSPFATAGPKSSQSLKSFPPGAFSPPPCDAVIT